MFVESTRGGASVYPTRGKAAWNGALGLKLTQSSPLLIVESSMTTPSLRNVSHPSVFFAAFFDVDAAAIVTLRNVTWRESLTCSAFVDQHPVRG